MLSYGKRASTPVHDVPYSAHADRHVRYCAWPTLVPFLRRGLRGDGAALRALRSADAGDSSARAGAVVPRLRNRAVAVCGVLRRVRRGSAVCADDGSSAARRADDAWYLPANPSLTPTQRSRGTTSAGDVGDHLLGVRNRVLDKPRLVRPRHHVDSAAVRGLATLNTPRAGPADRRAGSLRLVDPENDSELTRRPRR